MLWVAFDRLQKLERSFWDFMSLATWLQHAAAVASGNVRKVYKHIIQLYFGVI